MHIKPFRLLSPCVIWTLTMAAPGVGEEPKPFRELRTSLLNRSVADSHIFTFSAFADGGAKLDKNLVAKLPGKVQAFVPTAKGPRFISQRSTLLLEAEGYAFWLFPVVYANRTEAIDAAIEGLAGQSPNVFATGNLAEAFVTEPVWRDVPKVFWNMESEGQPIGDFSFGKRAQGWDGYALYSVTFLRDNRVIRVECSRLKGDYRNPEKSIDPDPRQIAAALDRYYSADPTVVASVAEKSERNTLRIEIQSPRPLVKGTAYAFACPLNQEGNDLTEVRFRVTQGEVLEVVNEVAERPRRGVVPMEDRRFSVRFTKGGRQTLSCYHINAAGECLAWGKLEVEVLER